MANTPTPTPTRDRHDRGSSAPLRRVRRAARATPGRLVLAGVVALLGLLVVGVPSWLVDPGNRLLISALHVVGTLIFLVGGVAATRVLARQTDHRLTLRGMVSAGSVLRLGILIAGYLLVGLTALSLLSVPLQQVLVGGALTGVVVGIAAQQTLGNVFAGLVIVVVRPFRVGDVIEVRSGALNGPFVGRVTALGLTYVTMSTEEGTLLLPNAGVLAAGVTVNLSAETDRDPAPEPEAAPGPNPAPEPAVQPGRPQDPGGTANPAAS